MKTHNREHSRLVGQAVGWLVEWLLIRPHKDIQNNHLNFPVTSSICFSFGLSCSAAVELPFDSDTLPTSSLLLGATFKNFFL